MHASILLGLFSVFILSGCMSRPAQEFGFGQPPTVEQARGIVQEHLDFTLKDPGNIQGLIIGRPEAGCYQRGPGKRDVCGYLICASYNAKNSFGGYVGRKTYAYWVMKRWGLNVVENRGICPVSFEDWHGEPPVEIKDFCKFQPQNTGCLAGKTEEFAPAPVSVEVPDDSPAKGSPGSAPAQRELGVSYDQCMARVLRISDPALRVDGMSACDQIGK